jgi:NAD(P)-dependent dehydrogenase (short-subunit alcohol dehydrogenase family)
VTEGRGDIDFTGKVIVVTGGARGVGRGIAEAFLGAGAEVAVCGRHEPVVDELPGGAGRRAAFFTADVREAEEAESLIHAVAERFGRVDVLVNNAGGSPAVPAADASPRFVAQVVALNLLAPMYCSQAANAVMQRDGGGGSIINIGSVSGLRPSPGTAAYGAAKAGLINLTRTLAVEWAPKVRVNCVVAGLIATEAAEDHYGGAAGLAAAAATVPLGRMGTPDDVAGACLFLASPLASYVSGAALEVHGGGEGPAFLTALEGA